MRCIVGPERFDDRVFDAGGELTHGAEKARGTELMADYPGCALHAPVGADDRAVG